METIIKYIKLPLDFDADKMQAEVRALTNTWLPHYNTNDYTGGWDALPLRSINASTTHALAQKGNSDSFEDTMYMDQCPYIKAVTASFQFEKLAIRLLSLKPGAVIKEHKDPGLCYEEGLVRIHIPVQTHKDVTLYLDDELLELKAGECWYMNFNLKHRLANNSTADRIHLVIDGIANEWTGKLFDSCDAVNIKRLPVAERHTVAEKHNIISQLRLLATPVALEMAIEMEAGLMSTLKNLH